MSQNAPCNPLEEKQAAIDAQAKEIERLRGVISGAATRLYRRWFSDNEDLEFVNDLAAHLLKEIGFDYANQDAPEA